MVIAADHIQIFGDGVLGADPHDLENLVAKTVHAEGGIVDIRVVERLAVLAKKVSRDIGESGLRIAGRHVPDVFVAGV